MTRQEPLYTTEVNCETGEVIRRELTEAEYAQREIDVAKAIEEDNARRAEEAAKAAAKASAEAKLASLGLTAEEIAALSK